jgi:hypothetical protein
VSRVEDRTGPGPRRDTILGEFRTEGDKVELRPAIEIETAQGIVKVPVEDLSPLAPE